MQKGEDKIWRTESSGELLNFAIDFNGAKILPQESNFPTLVSSSTVAICILYMNAQLDQSRDRSSHVEHSNVLQAALRQATERNNSWLPLAVTLTGGITMLWDDEQWLQNF
ncbi:hypothetical protein UY3_14643 [Chelonia mydas]|uniref:Uncharacterized protein n=1 Tax=Chelonia mydas TaxID=8469 RepID=M7B7X4_CHEMY|nr:hypothetical protein UY3_14643 [Chelonia mydas]